MEENSIKIIVSYGKVLVLQIKLNTSMIDIKF